MGACFKNVVWDGKLTYDEVKKKYQDMVNELLHMHGADAYNGTFTTCSGLAIQNGGFARTLRNGRTRSQSSSGT
jgi:hypothetical protein